MNLPNSLIISRYTDGSEFLYKAMTAVWGGSTLTIMEPSGPGSSELVERIENVDGYAVRGNKHTFTSSSEAVDSDGDVLERITVIPQGPGCRPCGT